MRTTVDIPDPLYRELKGKAASEGRSVKELILRGVEQELKGRRGRPGRVTLPNRALEAAGVTPIKQCQDLRDHSFSLM